MTVEAQNPTTVVLATGKTYTIPAGEPGTYVWVRQASLISVAYSQIGDVAKAAKWKVEHQKRARIWNAIEAGQDRAAVWRQFGADLLLAPGRILADIGKEALDLAKTPKALLEALAKLLPLLLVAAVVVIGIGFYKGTIKVSR